ncbi:MAG: N-6 DNA methylase [Verrucomicrobiota bacterium]
MNKKALSERDICTKYIIPALKQAGWDEFTQIREEVSFTRGRIIVRGRLVRRGKAKRADCILYYRPKGEKTQDIWFYEHRVPESQKAYSMTKPIRVEHFKPCVDWWGGPERKGRKETEVAWKVTADEVKARAYNLDFKNPHTVEADHGDPEELLRALDQSEQETAQLRDQLKAILSEALLRNEPGGFNDGSRGAQSAKPPGTRSAKAAHPGGVAVTP